MTDYDRLRKKREAEAMARLDKERAERRINEEKERQRLRKEWEKRKWDEMGLAKQRDRRSDDVKEAVKRSEELIKKLEDKKNQQNK